MVFEVSCPSCGPRHLAPHRFELWSFTVSPDRRFSRFVCDSCGVIVLSEADERALRLLLHAGVTARVLPTPAEVLEVREGEPLVLDDLIDLHFELERFDAATWTQAEADEPEAPRGEPREATSA